LLVGQTVTLSGLSGGIVEPLVAIFMKN